MRIVHVTNYLMPEVGYQDHYLAKYQAEAGHEVHVITSNRAYPPQKDYSVFSSLYPSRTVETGVERRDGYTLHRLQAHLERNMQLVLGGLISEIRSLDPDLVIAHGFTRFETMRLAFYKSIARASYRLVVDDHTLWSAYVPALYRRIYHALFRATFLLFGRSVDRIVPVSDETATFLTTIFGVHPSSMTMLPLGADCDLFTFDPSARNRIREQLGIPADGVTVLYAGKVTEEKGVHLLWSAFERGVGHNPKAFLLIVGSGIDGNYAARIRSEVESRSFDTRVIWHRHVSHDELPAFFSAADIAVWPSQETMGALEAAACGCPLILPDSAVGRERTAGGNGLTCGSAEDLEAALARLVEDGHLRETMGRRGAQFVRERFDWRVIARSFAELGAAVRTP